LSLDIYVNSDFSRSLITNVNQEGRPK
jgi:hypothetical protein